MAISLSYRLNKRPLFPAPISPQILKSLSRNAALKRLLKETYPYLEIGMQLCHPHYCKIVEFKHNHDKNKRKKKSESQKGSRKKVINENAESQSLEITNKASTNNSTFASKINILTKVLYDIHRRKEFEKMIEEMSPELKGFFPSMVNAIIPKERSAHNKQEAKKSIVALCYMISGLRNKFVNQLKTEVGLYLAASGATWEAIDTMSSLGYSACSKTIEEYRKKIQKEHLIKIEQHFTKNKNIFHIYNIDDYHSIHENRRPDTVSTSTAKHFATCVAKPIIECPSIPLVFNGISIHNPLNVEAPRICWYLINKYFGVFDLSYLQKHSIINQFDRIEMLTIHNYNDNITERKEERSMKGLQLIGFKEQNLHSIFDYINALKIILSVHDKTQHLKEVVAPIVADWPGQIFIRKALHMQTLLEIQSNFSQDIRSFLPMLGPLHVSLNSREQVMLIHHSFFEKLFHFVFGENKKLAKKPRPWRINLLLELAKCGWIKIKDQIIQKFGNCKDIEYRTTIDLLDNLIPAVLDIYAILFRSGLFEEYVETIFRIWTFALRWKRKNYNKAPLVFLSDLFYWKDHNHPFYNVLQKHLSGFNDYFVENTHSKIRANTSSNATADNIIKQAYVIMNQDPIFKNTYCKTRNYPYNNSTLDFLSNKTSIFLLQYFHNLYNNLEKSAPKLNKKIKKQNPKIYILATLEEEVDLRRLPTGYSTSYPPKQGLCDRCKLPFVNEDGSITFIYGHGYHTGCYNGKCTYCEEYYKRGIFDNVDSFLKRIEKGADTLTQEDLDDEGNDIEEEEEQTEEIEMQDISNRLEIEISQIENW
ncbi:hypothetical protein Glove_566g73 [Diversispora epigaea]|uniref:Uncharacterized protein n=1 Tax=Diversispora epigaea TaxID=1348612 RepID=A0A397GE02_9GLOM|nr:hypothetical protein Glove_566g73 [Diversispora epigaea]